MNYDTAYALLPLDAKWSCSFGNPGEGGYFEYYRDANGDRWIISNGPWFTAPNFMWNCVKD